MTDTRQPRFKMGAMLSRLHRFIYVLLRGRFVSHRGDVSFLLLSTIGRKTRRTWTVPLLYIMDGTKPCVVASRGGHHKAPDWLLNITAENRVRIQIGPVSWDGMAEIATEEEREKLWPVFIESYGGYASYQARTTRQFPIVIITLCED
ncbi:MAG: nitroreductase family deazaflavin-dependent oxidoreductase [Dehalococcoidia bacterium]|nr:nitroreductase family deazaflavin-dependent oxidoreductase [Dehalococcoidia bacterium]